MRKAFVSRGVSVLALGVIAFSWTSIAKADNVVVAPAQAAPAPAPAVAQTPAPAPVVVAPAAPATTTTTAASVPGPVVVNNGGATSTADVSTREYVGPNRTLLMSGIFMAGVPYLASLGVAAGSNHQGDSNLYVPVIGPWLDIGHRGDCPVGSSACDSETANKFFLGADGVLQAVGALQIIGAFMFPETRAVTTVPATALTPAMTIAPAKMGKAGYGLSLVGEL